MEKQNNKNKKLERRIQNLERRINSIEEDLIISFGFRDTRKKRKIRK